MLRALLVLVISTAAASAAAVPPYEPLPKTKSTTAPVAAPRSTSSAEASVYSGSDSGFSYAPAVDNTSSGSGSVSASWDTLSQMQQMQQEMLDLRGMVEELKHQIDIMQKQERERYLDLDMRINQIQSGSPGKASSAPSAAAPATGDEKALYEQASDLRKNGKYSEAIATLEQLLKQSPDGLYAPYGEYWLGELYMVSDPVDLDQAKRHFINLLANYPGHAKVPDGMYKLGKLYAGKGETSKAKSTLNELIKQYPDKSAAKLAKDLLKSL